MSRTSGGAGGGGGGFTPASKVLSRAFAPDTGLIAETVPRVFAGVNQNGADLSGTLLIEPVELESGLTVSFLATDTGTTAATAPTHFWMALLDNNRNMLAVTADQGAAAIPATTRFKLAVANVAAGPAASFTTTYSGVHFIGRLITATTLPSSVGVSGAGSGMATYSQAPFPAGNSDAGLTVPPAFPHQFAAPGAGAQPVYWMGLY